jgi:hypothetical protein
MGVHIVVFLYHFGGFGPMFLVLYSSFFFEDVSSFRPLLRVLLGTAWTSNTRNSELRRKLLVFWCFRDKRFSQQAFWRKQAAVARLLT